MNCSGLVLCIAGAISAFFIYKATWKFRFETDAHLLAPSAHNLTVCSLLHGNGSNLIEWIAFHLEQGYTKFVFYVDLENEDDDISKIDNYQYVTLVSEFYNTHQFLVDVVVAPRFAGHKEDEVSVRENAYNHCFVNYHEKSKWIVFQETSQYVYSTSNETVIEVLERDYVGREFVPPNIDVYGSSSTQKLAVPPSLVMDMATGSIDLFYDPRGSSDFRALNKSQELDEDPISSLFHWPAFSDGLPLHAREEKKSISTLLEDWVEFFPLIISEERWRNSTSLEFLPESCEAKNHVPKLWCKHIKRQLLAKMEIRETKSKSSAPRSEFQGQNDLKIDVHLTPISDFLVDENVLGDMEGLLSGVFDIYSSQRNPTEEAVRVALAKHNPIPRLRTFGWKENMTIRHYDTWAECSPQEVVLRTRSMCPSTAPNVGYWITKLHYSPEAHAFQWCTATPPPKKFTKQSKGQLCPAYPKKSCCNYNNRYLQILQQL